MVDVKVNWRCNVTHTWAAEVPASEAYSLYAKLRYSHDTILALGCTPPPGASGPEGGPAPIQRDKSRERVANNMDVGIQQLDHGSETLPPPAAPANVTPRYPRLTASNVTSIVGKDWRKKHYPGASKDRHFFWGEAECGLILPSIWEVVTKEKGGLHVQILPGLLEGLQGRQPLLADHR